MSTVADVIDRIRIEINDSAETVTDATLLSLVKDAVERVNHLLFKSGVHFAKKMQTITTSNAGAYYSLPSDYMTTDAVYRDDLGHELAHCTDEEWELITTASEATHFRVSIGMATLEVAGTPSSEIELHHYYWPKIDTSSYTTTTDMPWSDRMNTPVKEYVALRVKNMDEMTLQQDVELMTDIVNNYINTYRTIQPSISFVRGYYPYWRRH